MSCGMSPVLARVVAAVSRDRCPCRTAALEVAEGEAQMWLDIGSA